MLEEIGQIVTGKTPSSNVIGAFSSSGIPFVTPKDMDGRRWIETTERYLSEAGRQSLKNYLIPKDSVAVSCIGSDMGKAILLKKDSVTNQQINTIIVDASKHNPKYIYYVLSLKQEELKSIAGGSATPILNKGHFSKVVIELPDKVDQDNIVQVLDSLDCKIELNNQINQNLESMAQAMFKSWFIDFDPVRAKIAAKQEGKDSELAAMCAISGKSEAELEQMAKEDFAELQATAALFPDELVESELGEVPRGWEVGCIGDEVNTVSKTYPLKQVKEVVFLNTGDILKGKFLHANKSSTEGLPGQAKKSIQKDDILYSEIRPQNKRFAYVYFNAENYVVSTKLMVLRQKSKVPSHFVYFILSQQSTIDFLQVMAESRSGTFPQITFDVLSKVEYLKPNNDALIDIFTRKVLTPFFEKKVMNETENNKLLGIRDIVLPKLLSGQLDLSRLASEAEYESSTE